MNLKRTEKAIFIFLCLMNCYPIFAFKFFPTADGPTHLYNANLINQLLFHPSALVSEYFSFNNEPVPNWTGHVLLSLMHWFIPARVAEKILLLIIVCGTMVTYRWLIEALGCKNMLLSWLILPFVYSFPLYLGFYNFCLALVFMFGTMSFYFTRHNRLDAKTFFLLLLLLSLTYFSHIFVFAFLLMLLILFSAFTNILKEVRSSENEDTVSEKSFIKKITFILLASLPILILFAYYFLSRPAGNNPSFMPKHILGEWLLNIRPLVSFSELDASPITKKICYVLILFLSIALFNRIYLTFFGSSVESGATISNGLFRQSDFLLVAAGITLVLYLILPDEATGGGFVSIRLALFLFLILVTWISVQQYPTWVIFSGVIMVLFFTAKLSVSNFFFSRDLSKIAIDCNRASDFIEENSRILPLKFSDHWLTGHYSNYIGIDKSVVLFDNYEASNSYFPLRWKVPTINSSFLQKPLENEACQNLTSQIKNSENNYDYIFITGNLPASGNDCIIELLSSVRNNYFQIYKTGNCELWKKK